MLRLSDLSGLSEAGAGKVATVAASSGISSLARGTAWTQGVSLLQEMCRGAVEVDSMALTGAISLFSGEAAGTWTWALQLLEDAYWYSIGNI